MKKLKPLIAVILILSIASITIPADASAFLENKSVSAGKNTYTDIEGKWFEKSVLEYGYTDIFSGTDGRFNPDVPITRMEFARLLHKALNININYFAPTNINEYFTDVKNEECGANELYDLATCGVIGSTGLFRPSESLTREDMIRYAVNAFFCCVSPDYAAADTEKKSFSDDSAVESDFKEYIRCAAILGLVNGRSGNLLELSDKATRAEAVTVAGRLADMKAQIDSSVYVKASAKQSDGELVLSFSLANNTEKTVMLTSTNSQTFDFVIFDKDGKQIYRWSNDKVFSTVITKTKIEPGKEAFFSDKIDAKTYSSIKDKIFCIKAYPVGTSSDFSINPNGYIVFDTNLD